MDDVKEFAMDNMESIHYTDEYDNSALYYACICGHFDVAKYLLDCGARDDKFGRCYISALVFLLFFNFLRIWKFVTC